MSTRQIYHNFNYGIHLLNKLYDNDKFNINISKDNSVMVALLGCGVKLIYVNC